ncbi:DUF3137 domain-containing protein [Paradesertivirga mongoliensis]|uniref:DUF3137 domain-containing protein n=1 Tax=Paradesertivirga mongoliensis TaxID=2100740 RepID=A0ABW4ZM87_9SPHI|nr:DUF3137 domain-containing protein [Pedobacter mongoliensis]
MPEQDSQAALLELEEQRLAIKTTKLRSFYFMAAGVLLAAAGLIFEYQLPGIIGGALFLTTGFVFFYKGSSTQGDYVHDFKQKVIRAALLDINPSLRIEPERGLSIGETIRSGLFSTIPDRVSSEDQITGRLGKTVFCFSEVHAEYKTTTRTKNGTKETWHDIFRGIVFVADFNKNFEGVTVIRPKDAGAAISAWFAKNVPVLSSSSHQLVQLENPDFCKEFVTYSSDQVEARYILTPLMMERLCELNSRSEYTIAASFIDHFMFLAFPFDTNYFEPPVFKTLLDPNLLHDDIEVVSFMLSIVETLDLNTRIWGKK